MESSKDHSDDTVSTKCWYTRREGVQRGPFTAEDISQYMLLGRIRMDDELSQDCKNWTVAEQQTSLLPDEITHQSSWDDYQELIVSHMKKDERKKDRRRNSCKNYLDHNPERRVSRDRRAEDENALLSQYLYANEKTTEKQQPRSRHARLWILTAILATLTMALLNPIQS